MVAVKRSDRVVVNFGAGVQSSALAMMAINAHPVLVEGLGGVIPQRWIFADTGDEPAEVYAHLDVMRERLEGAGFDLKIVRKGGPTLSEHITSVKTGVSLVPFYVADRHGNPCPVRRKCTSDFKVRPINRQLTAWFGKRPKEEVVQVFGISADESQRMRIADKKWLRFVYPLVRMGWKRSMCVEYLDSLGINAPRSACVFCPFHDKEEWMRVRRNQDEFNSAVEFERLVHARYDEGVTFGLKTKPYLHPHRVPIGEVDFDNQMSLFSMDDECGGVCGV